MRKNVLARIARQSVSARWLRNALPALCALFLASPGALGGQTATLREENVLDMRLGGLMQLGSRNTLVLNELNAATGSMPGFDLFVHYKGIGLRARLNGGEFTDESGAVLGEVAEGEAMIRLGTPPFALEGGYARRGLTSARGSSVLGMYRGGVHLEAPIGSSGFSGRIVGGAFFPADGLQEASGFDLETAFLWLPKRFPMFLMLGYRYEQFVVSDDDTDRPQEMGSVLLGAGVRFAR